MKTFLIIIGIIIVLGPFAIVVAGLFGAGIRNKVEGEDKSNKKPLKTLLIGLPFFIILMIVLAMFEKCTG